MLPQLGTFIPGLMAVGPLVPGEPVAPTPGGRYPLEMNPFPGFFSPPPAITPPSAFVALSPKALALQAAEQGATAPPPTGPGHKASAEQHLKGWAKPSADAFVNAGPQTRA